MRSASRVAARCDPISLRGASDQSASRFTPSVPARHLPARHCARLHRQSRRIVLASLSLPPSSRPLRDEPQRRVRACTASLPLVLRAPSPSFPPRFQHASRHCFVRPSKPQPHLPSRCTSPQLAAPLSATTLHANPPLRKKTAACASPANATVHGCPSPDLQPSYRWLPGCIAVRSAQLVAFCRANPRLLPPSLAPARSAVPHPRELRSIPVPGWFGVPSTFSSFGLTNRPWLPRKHERTRLWQHDGRSAATSSATAAPAAGHTRPAATVASPAARAMAGHSECRAACGYAMEHVIHARSPSAF